MGVVDRLRQRLFPRQELLICEVSSRCNLDCLYCYNVWKNAEPYPLGAELNADEWIALLGSVQREMGTSHVTFSGGEPLLRDDVPALVRGARALGLTVNLITNGTRLDAELTQELVQAGVAVFELPLLSDKREVHNELQQGDSFDAVTLSVARIKAAGGLTAGMFVATRRNIGDLERTLRLAHAVGCDGLMLLRFNPGGRGCQHADELLPSLSAVRDALAVADEFAAAYGFPISCGVPMQPCLIDRADYPNLSFGHCSAGAERAYYTIGPSGELRFCNHSPTILGNLREQSFRSLTRRSRIAWFVTAQPPFCTGCDAAADCRGGCKAAAEVCYGDPSAEEPFLRANRAHALRPESR